MEEDAKIAAQKSGRLSFYVVNAIADGCTRKEVSLFSLRIIIKQRSIYKKYFAKIWSGKHQ